MMVDSFDWEEVLDSLDPELSDTREHAFWDEDDYDYYFDPDEWHDDDLDWV